MPPKYVYNHCMLFDSDEGLWKIYHKLSKKIPKTVECYGSRVIASGESESICLKNFESIGGKPWDVQIVNPEKLGIDLPENLESGDLND